MMSGVLAWAGAVAIGISLGLFGSGGSILTVPVLLYLFGQDEKVAIAGSLGVVATIAAVGAIPFIFQRRVDWRNVVAFGVPGMVGTYLGAWIAGFVPGSVQLALFAIVMLLAAYFMLRPPRLTGVETERRAVWKIAIDGLMVGILTGLVGVGGGFLIVPALVLLGGMTIHRAVATSLVIIALKSSTGFLKYLDVLAAQGLAIDWNVLAIVAVLGITGSLIGGRIGGFLPRERLARYFGIFLVVMAIVILAETAPEVFRG